MKKRIIKTRKILRKNLSKSPNPIKMHLRSKKIKTTKKYYKLFFMNSQSMGIGFMKTKESMRKTSNSSMILSAAIFPKTSAEERLYSTITTWLRPVSGFSTKERKKKIKT